MAIVVLATVIFLMWQSKGKRSVPLSEQSGIACFKEVLQHTWWKSLLWKIVFKLEILKCTFKKHVHTILPVDPERVPGQSHTHTHTHYIYIYLYIYNIILSDVDDDKRITLATIILNCLTSHHLMPFLDDLKISLQNILHQRPRNTGSPSPQWTWNTSMHFRSHQWGVCLSKSIVFILKGIHQLWLLL